MFLPSFHSLDASVQFFLLLGWRRQAQMNQLPNKLLTFLYKKYLEVKGTMKVNGRGRGGGI